MDDDGAARTLKSIQMARKHAVSGRHGPATALLMQALREVPQLAEELEAELTFSLKTYGEHLAAIGQSKNALWVYTQAIPLLPRPRGLYTNLGTLQYSIGKAAAAIASFQRALDLDPNFWPARESLENVKSLAVDRWHYRMLNHSARNEAYRRAIWRAIAAAKVSDCGNPDLGVTVLDIGTGTGILAVMAARAGASHVYACEVNSVLCDVAREVLERNGVTDQVTVINKSSAALQPGVDLPNAGVDVIVTELVDSGLLGERIIPVLADARARGLLKEGGRVIPQGAQVFAAVVDSEAVKRRSRLLPDSPAGLSAKTACPKIEEPYTCEDLGRLKHLLLTSPTAVLEIDFLKDGAALMARSPPTAGYSPRKRQSVRLPVQRSGRADAIAVWFDLWLDGERGNQDVVSTRPERWAPGDASGWDAGIYFASGASLQEGSEVALEASAGRDRLHLTLNGREGVAVESLTSNAATAEEASRQKAHQDQSDNASDSGKGREEIGGGGDHCFVGEMDMARLNDGSFHKAHAHAVARALVARGISIKSLQPLTPGILPAPSAQHSGSGTATASSFPPARVLDLCGTWSLAGLLVAQLERCDGQPATRVMAVAESPQAAAVLNALARENGLGPNRYMAIADRLVDVAFRSAVAADGEHRGSLARGQSDHHGAAGSLPANRHVPGQGEGLSWSVVMASSLVEGSGLLKQGELEDLGLCRRFMCGGGGGGDTGDDRGAKTGLSTAFVPCFIYIVCRGLQRASLLSENRVRPECCSGVDVSPVNSFGVANFRELDLSPAACAAARRTSQFGKGSDVSKGHYDAPEAEGGALSGFPREDEAFLTAPAVCYDLELANVRAERDDGCLPRRHTRIRVQRDGTLHAVAYWYRQRLFGEVEIDTGPCASLSDEGGRIAGATSHFRQAAVILDRPVEVKEGQFVDLCVFCNTSQGVVVQVLGIETDHAAAADAAAAEAAFVA